MFYLSGSLYIIYHRQFLNTWFSFSFLIYQHNHETSSSTQGNLINFFAKTNRYGKYSVTVHTVESWNKIQKTTKRYAT